MTPLMIVSRPRPCRNCGKDIRMVLIPSLGPAQHLYENFEPGVTEMIVQHDCPNWTTGDPGDIEPFRGDTLSGDTVVDP